MHRASIQIGSPVRNRGATSMPMIYRLCNWIGKLTGTIVLVPHLWCSGDRAEHTYFGLLKARRERKKLFILLPYELPWRLSYNMTNAEISDVESEYRAFPSSNLPYIVGRVLITV